MKKGIGVPGNGRHRSRNRHGTRSRFCGILAAVFAVLLLVGPAGSALGNETFTKLNSSLDVTKKGSVTLTLTDPETKRGMHGISLELTQVASIITNSSGNYEYAYTDSFKDCETRLEQLSEADMGAREAAAVVQTYAVAHNITGTVMKTDTSGKVSYTGLAPGVYLVRNNPAAPEGTTIRSFLVTVPRLLNNEYVYDVDATAKPEVSTDTLDGNKTPPPSTETETETETTSPPKGGNTPPKGGSTPPTGGGRLPQTGQLWWPVPVLTAGGLILIIAGIIRRRKGAVTRN